MDGVFFCSVDFGQISECLDMLDPEIGIVLEQLCERSRNEIKDELIRDFAGNENFRMAMDKVDCCQG